MLRLRRPRARWRVAARLTVVVTVGAAGALGACARQPITTSTGATGAPGDLTYGTTVTTRPGTTTTESTTTTEAPATTVAGGTGGTVRVFEVDADLTVEAKVGESFELHIEEDEASGFTWKAGQEGESVRVTAARTEEPAEPGGPKTVVGVYTAEAEGETTVTFSAAKADGTPGDQWRVRITVAAAG